MLIVGLAPGLHGANRTGRPFCGDQSGELLFGALHRSGLRVRAITADGKSIAAGGECRENSTVRITNALKCLPPANKPTTAELNNCQRYLSYELDQLGQADAPVVALCLGRLAHRSVLRCCKRTQSRHPFKHGAQHWLSSDLVLIDSYHCSRYNVQTGRLSQGMFQRVVDEAGAILESGR